jgi:hypothetical protein
MKYDEDLYQWTIEQGRALRDRATNALDYDNLGACPSNRIFEGSIRYTVYIIASQYYILCPSLYFCITWTGS